MAEASPFVWGTGGSKDTIDNRRRMAEALLKSGSDTSPVQHWTQGLARVAQALTGAMYMRDADSALKAAQASDAADFSLLSGNGSPSGVGAPAAPSFAGGAAARTMAMPNITPEIKTGIADAATALGVSPVDLATTISYETGGTFDPTKAGPTTKWGQHRGLIQFGEPQAKQYGVDWSNPAGSQLGANGAIVAYLRDRGVKPGMSLMDIYSTINAGAPGLYGASDERAGGAPGTVADKVNSQMAGHRAKAQALFADLPAAGASPVAMETGQNGFAVPPAPAPAMNGSTFNAIASALDNKPLDPVFQTEGLAQPWFGTALQPEAPAGPQMVQAPLPPSRPTDLAMPQADMPAAGAVPAMGQLPPNPAPIIADPTKDNAGVLSGLVASEEQRKGLPSGASVASPLSAIAQALTGSPASAQAAPAQSPPTQRIAQALSAPPAASAEPVAPSAPVPSQAASVGSQQTAAALRILNSPYALPGQRAIAQAVIQKSYADPNDAILKQIQVAKGRRELEGEGAVPLTEAERKSFGIKPDQSAYKTRSGDIKFGPAGTTVNVDTKAENAEAQARGAGVGKRLNDLADDGAKASEDAVLFQRFGDILNTVKTGKSTETLEKIRQATGLALDPNTDNVQALNALIQYIGPRLRVPGSGAQSDRELGNFLASIPSLAGTPEGNRKILETMQGIIDHRKQRAGIASEWQLGDISAKEAQSRIDKLPSPFAKKEQAPVAAPDRAALEAEARRRGLIK